MFAEKDSFITNWNNQEEKSHVAGHNQFSDWTKDEFNKLLGYKPPANQTERTYEELDNVTPLPDSINWVTKGAVNPVQNQG